MESFCSSWIRILNAMDFVNYYKRPREVIQKGYIPESQFEWRYNYESMNDEQ